MTDVYFLSLPITNNNQQMSKKVFDFAIGV